LHWIKGRKIAQLHREAARRAAHFSRDLDDNGITAMQLSERKFAIQIECN
jgi:hypothetical protein